MTDQTQTLTILDKLFTFVPSLVINIGQNPTA